MKTRRKQGSLMLLSTVKLKNTILPFREHLKAGKRGSPIRADEMRTSEIIFVNWV